MFVNGRQLICDKALMNIAWNLPSTNIEYAKMKQSTLRASYPAVPTFFVSSCKRKKAGTAGYEGELNYSKLLNTLDKT